MLGIISGFTGGWIDAVIGRFIDLTLSFPHDADAAGAVRDRHPADRGPCCPARSPTRCPTAPTSSSCSASSAGPAIARIVRGQVLSIREREFVDAARLLGASRSRIYFKEILPNLWAPLLVYFTLTMPAYISAEAALSYLGVGIKPPTPTLGNILTDSINYSSADFFFFFTPAFLIMIIVVSFNLLGDGIRDALDPKTRRPRPHPRFRRHGVAGGAAAPARTRTRRSNGQLSKAAARRHRCGGDGRRSRRLRRRQRPAAATAAAAEQPGTPRAAR